MSDGRDVAEWQVVFFRAVEAASGERELLGPLGRPRTCCFCHRSEPEARFKSESHVLPQAFGNRTLLSSEECDDCNAAGSKLENHLVAIMSSARIVSVVGPRRPQWTFRHKSNSSSAIRVRPSAYALEFAPDPEDPTVRVRRTRTGGMSVTTKIPPFSPYDVSQALARIAWFTMSREQRGGASHLLPWLRNEVEWSEIPLFLGSLAVNAPGGTKGPIIAVSTPRAGLQDDLPWFDVRLTLGRTVLATLLPGPSLQLGGIYCSDGIAILGRKGELRTDFESTIELYSDRLASLALPTHAEIEAKAYARYVARGCADGHDQNDWLEAEQDLLWAQLEEPQVTDDSPIERKTD